MGRRLTCFCHEYTNFMFFVMGRRAGRRAGRLAGRPVLKEKSPAARRCDTDDPILL